MSSETLIATRRDSSRGTTAARSLRRTGRLPGVLYRKGESVAIEVDTLELAAVMRHGTTIVDLNLDGESHMTVIKDSQRHPVRGDLVHVDLQEVRTDETVKTSVPVHIIGEDTSPGVKNGGALAQAAHEVHIESRPGAIPEFIEVDISAVEAGESVHLGDISAPEGVTFLDDDAMVIVAITVPRLSKKGDDGADGEAAEGDAEADATAEGDDA